VHSALKETRSHPRTGCARVTVLTIRGQLLVLRAAELLMQIRRRARPLRPSVDPQRVEVSVFREFLPRRHCNKAVAVKMFAEQPSPAALQWSPKTSVSACGSVSHELGHQRGEAFRIGGCSSRTGAGGDRMQRDSIRRHQNEGTHCSSTEQAFFTPFEIGHSDRSHIAVA
jgi:hypothetical protein